MTASPTPLSALGVRCWRDVISPEDPMVELGYDEGGGGWWPLSTLVFVAD